MKKFLIFSLLTLNLALMADLNEIGAIATEALKEADFVVIGTVDEQGVPTAVLKGKGVVIQRYSLKDIPVKAFPQNNQVYVFSVTDGVFIDRPEIEEKIQMKVKEIK